LETKKEPKLELELAPTMTAKFSSSRKPNLDLKYLRSGQFMDWFLTAKAKARKMEHKYANGKQMVRKTSIGTYATTRMTLLHLTNGKECETWILDFSRQISF
jgi:hypothetical protein